MAWRAPRAGEFRDRITIKRNSNISDGMGGTTSVFTTVTGCDALPAKIIPATGGEAIQSERLSGTKRFDVIVRTSAAAHTIVSSDHVVNDRTGEVYAIKFVGSLEVGRQSAILMTCTTGELR